MFLNCVSVSKKTGQFDIEQGWSLDERNWAILTATENTVETAEQVMVATWHWKPCETHGCMTKAATNCTLFTVLLLPLPIHHVTSPPSMQMAGGVRLSEVQAPSSDATVSDDR